MKPFKNIQTERLELIPLTPQQLRLWIEDITRLELELNGIYQAEPMEGFFLNIVKGQLKITEMDPENYLWNTFWLMIRKTDRVVVGSADFKYLPDEREYTEIGYGLGKQFEHNGYMTEAVDAMCQWALEQDGVSHIIAETESDNLASQRILERCGFKQYKKADTIWWKLSSNG